MKVPTLGGVRFIRYLGRYIATRVPDIRLEQSAAHKGIDGSLANFQNSPFGLISSRAKGSESAAYGGR